MIDIHSHILPNIDDGSSCIEESVKMLKEAYEVGFTGVVATSHYIEDTYNASSQKKLKLIKSIKEILKKENIEIEIYNGAEAYITTNLVELIESKTLPTINETKYLLMELPMNNKILYLNEIIYDLQSKGIIPIIAHPERYIYIQKNQDILLDLKQKGILFQANYGSIIGMYGKEAKKTLKKLLKNDMIDLLGTDTHRSGSIYQEMGVILKKYTKLIGKEKLEKLSNINPKKILNNESVLF